MGPSNGDKVDKVLRRLRISFDGPAGATQWPSMYQTLFKQVQRLGSYNYSEYEGNVEQRSLDEPWVSVILKRTRKLSSLAKRCDRERRNEAGWRLILEPEIFARFSDEVVWYGRLAWVYWHPGKADTRSTKCRARVWRSEIELALESTDDGAQALGKRRQNRRECKCDRWVEHYFRDMVIWAGAEDLGSCDIGINPLFSDRAEELVNNDSVMTEDEMKIGHPDRHPDRVYGLRETKVFEDVLSSQPRFQRSQLVKDTIETSPFRNVGEPLLFPFLILEAKSEKGADSWSSTQNQTAIPIYAMLRLQENLRKRSYQANQNRVSSLVWFFSNKGQEWRVHGCLVDNADEKPEYRILILWAGNLCSRDGALQLLLIIDHIFVWARNVYRTRILSQLRSLSADHFNDSDSDIASMGPSIVTDECEVRSEQLDEMTLQEESGDPPVGFIHSLDSGACAIRYASKIESRFFGLFITNDSLTTLLQSFETPSEARIFSFEVVSAVAGQSIMFAGKHFDHLQELWTGERPKRPTCSMEQEKFYTKVNFRFWLAQDWAQIRQLTCLAVAPDALDRLIHIAELKHRPNIFALELGWRYLREPFERFAAASINFNLLAAIHRLCLSINVDTTAPSRRSDSTPREPRPNRERAALPYGWIGLVEKDSDEIHVVVDDAYQHQRLGNQGISEAYIRQASHVREQTLGHNPDCDPWHFKYCLRLTKEGHVLVADGRRERDNTCLYLQPATTENTIAIAPVVSPETLNLDDESVHETESWQGGAPYSSVEWNLSTSCPGILSLSEWRKDRVITLRRLAEYWSIDEQSAQKADLAAWLDGSRGALWPVVHDCGADTSWTVLFESSWKSQNAHFYDALSLCRLAMLCSSALRICGPANPGKALVWLAKRFEDDMENYDRFTTIHAYTSSGDMVLEHSVNTMIRKIMDKQGLSHDETQKVLAEFRQMTAGKDISQSLNGLRSFRDNPTERQRDGRRRGLRVRSRRGLRKGISTR